MLQFDTDFADACATGPDGPVALVLREKLVPVEGEDAVIFPPTYPKANASTDRITSRYNIDTLGDGTTLATIDSVQSQANRIEPTFARRNGEDNPYADLVPQIDISYSNDRTLSLMELAHRLGDAMLRGTELAEEIRSIFSILRDTGDCTPLVKMAPTTAVFGAWDSRASGVKLPRIVQSVIRAWDVHQIERSALYTPAIDYREEGVYDDNTKAADSLAARGYRHVPNDALGGVVVRGAIQRTITINLIALRRMRGEDANGLRRYLLGLALAGATAPFDGFLRQGCILIPDAETPAQWEAVLRTGTRKPLELSPEAALEYARKMASAFGIGRDRSVRYDVQLAKQDANVR